MTDYYRPTEHSHKDDCNEMQYIDPDEVRTKKLEKIVEKWYDFHKSRLTEDKEANRWYISETIYICISEINIESHTEKYTPKEITNALMEWFLSEDIIKFLLTNYMENL